MLKSFYSQLTQEIKKEVSTSSTFKNERSSRMTTSNNSITSNNSDVNTTKYFIAKTYPKLTYVKEM